MFSFGSLAAICEKIDCVEEFAMSRGLKFVAVLLVISIVSVLCAQTATPRPDASFAPFEQWMGAVLTSDAKTLKSLYSTDPPAQVRVKTVMHDADADTNFWLGHQVRSMKVEMIRRKARPDAMGLIFRADIVPGVSGEKPFSVTDDQTWLKQGDHWRLAYVERTDAPALKHPSDMKKDLYPASADARTEIKEAEEKAAAEHKRVLLVFGANWCFDCHVLDLAFHGPELASLVDANYEVVHVDIGPDGHKNADLVKRYEIPMDKGVPAIAVVDSDDKLLVSEKNGEFEDARQLTPQYLADFLNKWKPRM
jgi:thioredoxin 1